MNLLIKYYIVCILLIIANLAQVGHASNKTILVIGDSISSGYGMAINDGWVSLLQLHLNQQGYPHNVINASITGDTSASGQQRISVLLTTHRPDIVILELGGNDGLRGLPISQLKSNLQSMIDQSLNHGAQVLLVGMQIFPNYGPRYTNAFKTVYTDLSKENEISLAPFVFKGIDDISQIMQADGVHPNVPAQKIILHNIWQHLELLL